MTITDKLCWKEHFYGKNGLLSSLNKRLFAIRRVANHVPHDKLIQLAHALWMSKLRYGLQLCTNVRILESETRNANMKSAQIAQNKMMRLLAKVPYNDRTSTSELLEKTGLLSVNQLAANIKLTEVWKSINENDYPIQLELNKKAPSDSDRNLRPTSSRLWNQDANSMAAKESFTRNVAKIWNTAPLSIKNANNIKSAKKEIAKHCKSLPI